MNGVPRKPHRIAVLVLLLASCAAPPLMTYTLGAPPASGPEAPLSRNATVIEVARVAMPDDIDTQDIVVRRGNELVSSHRGRWASRLSVGATELLAGQLARRRPDALVTGRPQTVAPTYRILINISRLDVMAGGGATLEADWLIVPHDPAVPTHRDRASLAAAGPTGTDQDTVARVSDLLNQLSASIDIGGLR